MSSRDHGRALRRLLAGLCLAAAAGSLTACGGGSAADASAPKTPAAVPADATTGRIAQVEFVRQCTIGTASFADESGITTDLDGRLTTAGLTHAQWKHWHDALVRSPALVAQLRTISSAGCPKG